MRTPESYSLTLKMATLESLAMLATLTALSYFISFFFRINHLRWLPCKVPKMAKHLVTAAWKASRFFWPSRALRMSWFRGILSRVTFRKCRVFNERRPRMARTEGAIRTVLNRPVAFLNTSETIPKRVTAPLEGV